MQEIQEVWEKRMAPVIAQLIIEARQMSSTDYAEWKEECYEHTPPFKQMFHGKIIQVNRGVFMTQAEKKESLLLAMRLIAILLLFVVGMIIETL